MKKHKVLIITLMGIGVLLIALLIAAWCIFGTQVNAAQSIKRLEDGLYSMEYDGDYGFDEFLKQGGAETDDEMADYIASFLSGGFWKPETSNLKTADFGCSTLSVKSSEDSTLFGRNYDWQDCTAMIVHTKPQNGYESISTCCLDFLGFGENWIPEGFKNRFLALAATYIPLDGMNEKGLCIADLMAGDGEVTHQDTDKPDITTTAAIRLILDHAASVDEATNLLGQYDMNSSIDSAHHFAIADSTGRSVVVEYIGGEMVVTDTNIVTNFYLSPGEKYGVGSEESVSRFNTLEKLYKDSNGIMSKEQVSSALASVAQSKFKDSTDSTQWSIVFDTKSLTAQFYRNERFTKMYSLAINNPAGWIEY